MTIALILIVAIASLAVIVESLREAFHDGPAPQGPPRSHRSDADFLPPGTQVC
jgi:hypothetical protein